MVENAISFPRKAIFGVLSVGEFSGILIAAQTFGGNTQSNFRRALGEMDVPSRNDFRLFARRRNAVCNDWLTPPPRPFPRYLPSLVNGAGNGLTPDIRYVRLAVFLVIGSPDILNGGRGSEGRKGDEGRGYWFFCCRFT